MLIKQLVAGSKRLRWVEALPPSGVPSRGALVLIHAFPLNARMWEPQLSLADQGWRVVAPQLRRFDGGSEPPVTSMDDYAEDVVDLLAGLEIDQAVIGGLSLGGYVSFALFRRAPQAFRAMVLADTRPQADTPAGVAGRRQMLDLLRERGPEGVADWMLSMALCETTRQTRPDVVEHIRRLMLASSPDAIGGAITAIMNRPDSTTILPTIRCPVLVIVGDGDVLTPPDVASAMHEAIAGSDLVVVPGSGHLPNLEQPVAFNAALSAFLDRRF